VSSVLTFGLPILQEAPGAVGYASIFWPAFTLLEGYILPQGVSEGSLRSWEQVGRSRQLIEWVMNHVHIADIHYGREESPSTNCSSLVTYSRKYTRRSFTGNSRTVRVRLNSSFQTIPMI